MIYPREFLKRFACAVSQYRGRLLAATCLIACGLQSSMAAAQEKSSPTNSLLGQVEVTPEGGLSFYTNYKGQRLRSFAITPAGSLIAGGVSAIGTPKTQVPPTKPLAEYDTVHDD